jgi:hypothetical protein
LPLRFEKQLGIVQNPFADCGRPLAPRGIQLAGLARIAVVLGEDGGHPLAVLQTLACRRHQTLQRHLRQDLAVAHLLLDRFRQNLHQRQPSRNPARAAIEPARQFIESIAEALLHLRQQPALFERALLRATAQRPRQQQRFGFAHCPNRGFYRVPAELFQRGHALVAIDHQVTVRRSGGHHDDGRLLAAVSQRRQQSALPVRLADSQMRPSPVQLVKLQLHRSPSGFQYARSRDWSFAAAWEVCREVSWDQ